MRETSADSNAAARARRPARRIARALPDVVILGALVVLALLFILYPVGCVVALSFQGDAGPTLDSWRSVIAESGRLVWNSAFTGVLAAVISTALSLLIATCVTFGNRVLSRAVTGIVLASLISPPFIASLAYIKLFGKRGLITASLLHVSYNPYGWHGVVAMQVLFFCALNVLLLVSVLSRIDSSTIRAARDLGARPSSVFMHVVLPVTRPALGVCLLLTFVRSISDFGTPTVIGGRFETVATEIYMQLIGYSDLPASAVLNVMLLAVSLVAFVCYHHFMKRSEALSTQGARAEHAAGSLSMRGVVGVLSYAAAVLFLVLMALQYLTIFYMAFAKGLGFNAQFTTANLEHMLERDLDPFVRSVEYALVTALVGTLVGALVAYYIQRRRIRFGAALEFVATMPYMIPGTCFGLGYILAFNSAPLKLTGTAVIIVANMIFKQLAITTKAFNTSFAQIDRSQDLAGQDLGAGRLRVLFDILLPNLRSAFVVSFVNSFSSAMITIGSVLFLVTPGHKIAVFELFDALNTGKYGEAAMISCFIIVLTVLVNVTMSWVVLRGGRSERGRGRGRG